MGLNVLVPRSAKPGFMHPDDPHAAGPFDKTIQGRTDQFIYKFRKP